MKACEAACAIKAQRRWAITGTPIQNSIVDLLGILKFLKCHPFDDTKVFHRWINNKHVDGRGRMIIILRCIMLRRTKRELKVDSGILNLPKKKTEMIPIVLDEEEKAAYNVLLSFSKSMLASYIRQLEDNFSSKDLPISFTGMSSFERNLV